MTLVKTNVPGFLKDTDSGVIINNDDEAYRKFLASRDAARNAKDLAKRVSAVESDLKEIKHLLLQIVNGRN